MRFAIVLTVSTELSSDLATDRPSSDSGAAIRRILDGARAQIRPMHPGVADPRLATKFLIDVADATTERSVVASLRGVPGVLAAYVKPADDIP